MRTEIEVIPVLGGFYFGDRREIGDFEIIQEINRRCGFVPGQGNPHYDRNHPEFNHIRLAEP